MFTMLLGYIQNSLANLAMMTQTSGPPGIIIKLYYQAS